MGVFDELLKGVSEDDKKVFEKYPALKQTTESMEQLLSGMTEEQRGYAAWYQANWDKEHGMTRGQYAAEQEKARLEQELAQLRDNPPEPGARPGLSAEDVNKIVSDQIKAVRDEQNATLNVMNNVLSFAARQNMSHFNEFGESLDSDKLVDFMRQRHVADPNLAYNQWVADKRAEKATQAAKDLEAKHAKDLEEARADERNKIQQELAMGKGGMLPTDTGGGILGVTRMPKAGELPQDIAEAAKGVKLGEGKLAELGLEAARRGAIPMQ